VACDFQKRLTKKKSSSSSSSLTAKYSGDTPTRNKIKSVSPVLKKLNGHILLQQQT
jgi:hypothetical protein